MRRRWTYRKNKTKIRPYRQWNTHSACMRWWEWASQIHSMFSNPQSCRTSFERRRRWAKLYGSTHTQFGHHQFLKNKPESPMPCCSWVCKGAWQCPAALRWSGDLKKNKVLLLLFFFLFFFFLFLFFLKQSLNKPRGFLRGFLRRTAQLPCIGPLWKKKVRERAKIGGEEGEALFFLFWKHKPDARGTPCPWCSARRVGREGGCYEGKVIRRRWKYL